jgi:hypothetical protein
MTRRSRRRHQRQFGLGRNIGHRHRFRLLNLYVLERDRWWRLATEEWLDSLVPHPREHPFGINNRGDNPASVRLPYTTKNTRYRCLEQTHIRWHPSDHDSDEKCHTEAGEADGGACNGGADRPHVSAESTGKKEERRLERHRGTLSKGV